MGSDIQTPRMGSLQQRAAKLRAETEAKRRHTPAQPDSDSHLRIEEPRAASTSQPPIPSDGRPDLATNSQSRDVATDAAVADPRIASSQCVGDGNYVVKQGDCLSSIAKDTGHFWATLWNDPANAEIRGTRNDPNVLLPDDRLHVPPLRKKGEPGATEVRHRFRRRGEPAMLRLTLQVDDEPLANKSYTLEVDGQTFKGVTDPEGKLACPIPGNARQGRLLVGEEGLEYELSLGHIDPVEHSRGVQQRLINLGFDCSRTDGEWDTHSRDALQQFQRAHGLSETDEADMDTREKLKEIHGS